ncbi:MAG: helix-turn-helix domain-containing protein [Bacteroidaceae bacterium]|nr:helix-turn-helix domain-containing protein [Bacteroidaceae bacterium]MDO5488929.1 helix-turn-helix domain-containing protein [Bacteroidaceae bacterium]
MKERLLSAGFAPAVVSEKVEQVDAMDFIVLNLGHACTVNPWGHRDISSPFIRLYYIKQGRAVLHLPEGDMEATAGHMYLIPSYVPHSYECDPGFDFYYLFVFQWLERGVSVFQTYDFPYQVRSNEATQLLFENYCNLYPQLNLPSEDAAKFDAHPSYREYVQAYMQMAHYERLQLHGLVEILFSYFVKQAKLRAVMSDVRMAGLMKYVQEHMEDPLSTEELARHACVTKCHLIRMFRSSLGVTPLRYITQCKVQHAQTLLLRTDLSVKQVGEAVGFKDISYFIRLFRRQLGFTPQEYREKLIG